MVPSRRRSVVLLWVNPLMFNKIWVTNKTLPALCADEWLFSRVCSLVYDEIRLADVALITLVTSIGPLSSVNSFVSTTLWATAETFPTFWTGIGLFSRVASTMRHQLRVGDKTLLALRARKWSFPRMDFLVWSEIWTVVETLSAYGTDILLLAGVDFLMGNQVGFAAKILTTVRAGELFFSRVDPLMGHILCFPAKRFATFRARERFITSVNTFVTI